LNIFQTLNIISLAFSILNKENQVLLETRLLLTAELTPRHTTTRVGHFRHNTNAFDERERRSDPF